MVSPNTVPDSALERDDRPGTSVLGLISTDAFLATHANARKFYNHVNKMEVRDKVLNLSVKLSEVLLLRLRATFHTLPRFYLRT